MGINPYIFHIPLGTSSYLWPGGSMVFKEEPCGPTGGMTYKATYLYLRGRAGSMLLSCHLVAQVAISMSW